MPFDKNQDLDLPENFIVNTPGFRLVAAQGGDGVNTTLQRTGSAPQTAFEQRFPRILGDIDVLRESITPGFSQIREARLRQVENARSRAIGNLRENLARRRLAGSSFAEDALIRAELEAGQAAGEAEAQSFLEELAANQQIIQQEAAQINDALNREFAELGVGANFASTAGNIIAANARFEEQLAAQGAAGVGQLLGSLVGAGIGAGSNIMAADILADRTSGPIVPQGSFSAGRVGSSIGFNPTFVTGLPTPVI